MEKYADYAQATYKDLFTEDQRKDALVLKANYFESAILWKDEKGFRLEALPDEAQLSPVFSILINDFDKDDKKDLMLFGNFYGLKPEVGRMDGNKGLTSFTMTMYSYHQHRGGSGTTTIV